jgi:hypothetical protein
VSALGKLPALFLAAIVLWLAWNVYRDGPEHAFGGLIPLLGQPQYGQADGAPTRSGTLADDHDDAPPESEEE